MRRMAIMARCIRISLLLAGCSIYRHRGSRDWTEPAASAGQESSAVAQPPFSRAGHPNPTAGDPLPPLCGGGEWAYLMFPTPDVEAIMGILAAVTPLTVATGGKGRGQ